MAAQITDMGENLFLIARTGGGKVEESIGEVRTAPFGDFGSVWSVSKEADRIGVPYFSINARSLCTFYEIKRTSEVAA